MTIDLRKIHLVWRKNYAPFYKPMTSKVKTFEEKILYQIVLSFADQNLSTALDNRRNFSFHHFNNFLLNKASKNVRQTLRCAGCA